MRPKIDLADLNNSSVVPKPELLTTLLVDAISSSTLGLPLNLLIIFLSFFSAEIDGEFKYFLGTLAVWDSAYCMVMIGAFLFQLVHSNFRLNATIFHCSLINHSAYGCGIAMVLTLPLIAINRYVVIVQQRIDFFTKRKTVLMCLYPCLVLIWPLIDFTIAPYATDYPRCGLVYYTPYLVEVFVVPVAGSYALIAFCQLKLYRFLSQHISTVSKILRRSEKEVAKERMILKAMMIQAVSPIVLSLPMTVYLYRCVRLTLGAALHVT